MNQRVITWGFVAVALTIMFAVVIWGYFQVEYAKDMGWL